MIVYKDRTFCLSDCTNSECSKYFDAGVNKDAQDAGLPVSLADLSKTCTSYTPPKTKKSEK